MCRQETSKECSRAGAGGLISKLLQSIGVGQILWSSRCSLVGDEVVSSNESDGQTIELVFDGCRLAVVSNRITTDNQISNAVSV